MAAGVATKSGEDETDAFRRQFSINLSMALDHLEYMPRSYGRITAAAQLFGVSANTMTGWIKGTSLPEMWRLPEIARKLHTTIDHLISGDISTPEVIDEQYAVIGIHRQNEPENTYALYALPETLKFLRLAQDIKFMRVDSSDVEDSVKPGDFIAYAPGSRTLGTRSEIFVLQTSGNVLIRRIYRTLRGQIVLSCDNPHMPDETLSDDDFSRAPDEQGKIHILGKVIGTLSLQSQIETE